MANPENDQKRQKGLISAEWITPPPIAAGARKRVVTRVQGGTYKSTVKYKAWDGPNSFSFLSDDTPFILSNTTTFEAKNNGTQISVRGEIRGKRLAKLVEGLLARQGRKDDVANFNRLRELLEPG